MFRAGRKSLGSFVVTDRKPQSQTVGWRTEGGAGQRQYTFLLKQGVGELARGQDVLFYQVLPHRFEIRPEVESTLRSRAINMRARDTFRCDTRYGRMDARAAADVVFDVVFAGNGQQGGFLYRCGHAGPGLACDGVQRVKEGTLVCWHQSEPDSPAAERQMFRQTGRYRGRAGTVRSDALPCAIEGGQCVDLVADQKDPVPLADIDDPSEVSLRYHQAGGIIGGV